MPRQTLLECRVRLYHGTSVDTAARILLEGFSPGDPNEMGRELCHRYGVDSAILDTPDVVSLLSYAEARFADQVVSFSTHWRVAAGYARQWGSETRSMLLDVIGGQLVGKTDLANWKSQQLRLWTPAVVTVESTFADLLEGLAPQAPQGEEALEAAVLGRPREMLGIPLHTHWVELRAPVPPALVTGAVALGRCVCQQDGRDPSVCAVCPRSLR